MTKQYGKAAAGLLTLAMLASLGGCRTAQPVLTPHCDPLPAASPATQGGCGRSPSTTAPS